MATNDHLRISLIGPGDIRFHYFELLKLEEKQFLKQIGAIAKVLAASGHELVLLPDRGVSFELAKRYKAHGGKKVYGTVPQSDQDFGIKHLRPYINAKTNDGKNVFDEIIDTQNWYKQDLTCCIFGDVILMLGNSLGSLGELVYGYYLYKLFVGEKPEVRAKKKEIHHEVRAGENVSYTALIYLPFVKEKLNAEIEAYIKKVGGDVVYVRNPQELKKALEECRKKSLKS